MTCAQVRQVLAAYRRDDWPIHDLAALTQHLTTCAECRQAEARYRGVGEHIRQLPSIAPPSDLRERVFAAIRAEEQRVSPQVARVARAATDPALPVVRPRARVVRPLRPMRPRVNAAAVLALAAVVALSLVSARLLSFLGVSSLSSAATSLATVAPLRLSGPAALSVIHYPLDARFTSATGALATSTWLVYSAADASGQYMLFAEERQTHQRSPLLAAPSSTPLTLRAVTDRWVIWSTGAGTSNTHWKLYASPLPQANGRIAAPISLVDSGTAGADTPVTLGGVSAQGDTVLLAAATASGSGALLRISLATGSPVTTVIARAATPGHLLTDPSEDNGAYYWAEVWFDSATGLHSAIWRDDDGGHERLVSLDEGAFHPRVAHGTLIWVEVPAQALANMTLGTHTALPDGDLELLNELNGVLEARDLGNGRQWVVSPRADVTSVQAAGTTLLWHSDSQTHAYDVAARHTSDVDQQVRGAAFVGVTPESLVWEPSLAAPLAVYDEQ